MEKKNSILLTVIAIATLLVAVVGATFAYFTASIQDNRTDENGKGQTNISTDKVVSSTTIANVDNAAGKFTVEEIYPGHKEVAALQVKVDGEANSKTGVDFYYDITNNTLEDQVKVSIYRSDTQIATTDNHFNCQKDVKHDGNEAQYYESCETRELGTLLDGGEHVLTGNIEKIKLGRDIIDLQSIGSRTVYYYVVVEFMDSGNGDQNKYMNKVLNGVVSVEPAPGVY